MAGIAIPDNLRPVVTAVAKHHFWILAALVPLVLIPTLVIGTGSLRGRIVAAQKQIEAKISQARAVTALQPHPNEAWKTAIEADGESVNREMGDEWRRFWHDQASLRIWPVELGKEFLDDVYSLKPGRKLDRQSLVRYQNMAPRLVRSLPQQMGVEDMMVAAGAGDATLGELRRPGGAALSPRLSWNPASQRRVYESFVWDRPPVTTQVLLAQEELWVYGLFCRILAEFVKDATGGHDSPLTNVDELAVGFQANEASDLTGQASRILMPKTAPQGGPEGMVGMEPLPGGEGPGQAPWHPRFSGAGGGQRPGAPGPGAGDQSVGPTEEDYRGWIYVDLDGKPLSVADLASRPGMQMVHLMPFVLRVTVDQRQLDRLLVALAASRVPIDVRQVRVNPGAGGGQEGFVGRVGSGDGMPGAAGGRQPNYLFVELRGSVALATDPAAVPATQPGPGTMP